MYQLSNSLDVAGWDAEPEFQIETQKHTSHGTKISATAVKNSEK